MKTKLRATVSERALVGRINRKLAKKGQQLRRRRVTWDGSNWLEDNDLGRYYIVDLERDFLVEHHVDLEEIGRDLKVLAGWEALSE